jgi:uncharacterized membrane protein YgcG
MFFIFVGEGSRYLFHAPHNRPGGFDGGFFGGGGDFGGGGASGDW